jgi:hypothetical protein
LSLLENPLALALESMRGRPTLRFLGTMKLGNDEGGWVDYSGGVCLCVCFPSFCTNFVTDASIYRVRIETSTHTRLSPKSTSRTYSVSPPCPRREKRQISGYASRLAITVRPPRSFPTRGRD